MTTLGATLRLGNSVGATNAPFDGAIDDARVYNRALSIAEIRELSGFAPGQVDNQTLWLDAGRAVYNNGGTTLATNTHSVQQWNDVRFTNGTSNAKNVSQATSGQRPTWQTNAWDSIIPNLIAGNYDAIMAGMSITDERKQSIDFSQNYLPPDPSFYMVRTGTTLDFNAISGKNIGVQGGTIQAGFVQQTYGANNTIKAYDTADQALADLSAGNLDVILADGSYVSEVIGGSGGALERIGEDVMLGNGIGVGLRKADDDLEGKLNAAIDEMKKDGSLDDLIVKWFPDKTKPIFATN